MDGFVLFWMDWFVQLQKVWPAESNHPVLHKVVHPYYVASGWVRERLNRLGRKSRRGPHFGVGAGVCLGRSAARGVACVWASWGVLGERLRSA